ncbi:hypothetical protein EK21DRAFT_50391, partial [Setomelanomma holmii]
YSPLDRLRDQIRLLKLFPKEGPMSPYHCDLEIFDLKAALPYTALSYAWGGTVQPIPLYTSDGCHNMIGQNLHDFLRHIAVDSFNIAGPWFWIDQVCIDQSNSHEKADQVSLMATIYQRCVSVITWLGCDLETTQAAREFPESRGPAKFKNLFTLLSNTYFSRLWIVQEML